MHLRVEMNLKTATIYSLEYYSFFKQNSPLSTARQKDLFFSNKNLWKFLHYPQIYALSPNELNVGFFSKQLGHTDQ